MPKVINVILGERIAGRGVLDDPERRVIQLFLIDGTLIAEDDSTMTDGSSSWFKSGPVVDVSNREETSTSD